MEPQVSQTIAKLQVSFSQNEPPAADTSKQVAGGKLSESSSASNPYLALLLVVSCASFREWLRAEQQRLNYADSSHNRGWERCARRGSFFDALTSLFRKALSDQAFPTLSHPYSVAALEEQRAVFRDARLKRVEWQVGRDFS